MNRNGTALIEAAAFFFAIFMLMVCMTGFIQWFVARQKVLLGAREAALMFSSGHFTTAEVEQRVRKFLTEGRPPLEPHAVEVRIRRRYWPIPSVLITQLDEVTVRYTRPGGWFYKLMVDPRIEETFVVKHAPFYWAPIQPWGGPPVS